GRLMQALPGGGAMAAVWAGEAQVRAAIAKTSGVVGIAAVNGPREVTMSGERDAVVAVCNALHAAGIRTHALGVSHAFHSPLMEPMLDEFAEAVADVRFSAPRCGFVSSVTGRPATLADVGKPAYWRRQVREPVRFQAGMETLYA